MHQIILISIAVVHAIADKWSLRLSGCVVFAHHSLDFRCFLWHIFSGGNDGFLNFLRALLLYVQAMIEHIEQWAHVSDKPIGKSGQKANQDCITNQFQTI